MTQKRNRMGKQKLVGMRKLSRGKIGKMRDENMSGVLWGGSYSRLRIIQIQLTGGVNLGCNWETTEI